MLERQQQFEEYKELQNKRNKKKWFWGCGGCLVLLILIAIGVTACTGIFVDKVNKNINKENTVDKDNQDEKGKKDKVKHVGDTVKVKDVEFTLKDAYYTDDRNQFADKDTKADKILKINMAIKNNGDSDIPVDDDVKVYIYGKQAKSSPVNNELIDGLSPGRSIEGSTGFAINGNPNKIELEYEQFLDFSNEKVTFELEPK